MMKTFYFMLLCSLSVLLAACNGRKQSAEGGKLVITVTIEPLRYFTEAIAGDRFTVVSMVPRGASPETYDPTPAQLVELSKSRAYFRIGQIGFEQAWAERLKENAPGLPFHDVSEGVETGTTGGDPHIWSSTVNARIIARNVLQALCSLDPADSAVYAARHDTLCQRIARTDSVIARRLATLDAERRAFLIYHPALTYFARDYGLHQIPIEADGKEPSPSQLKGLIDRCRAEGVRVIFVQPEFDRRNASLIAQQTGASIVPINPLSYDWEAEMVNIAQQLTQTNE